LFSIANAPPRQVREAPERSAALPIEEVHRMDPGEIRELYQYNFWANHRMLEACAALPQELFVRELGSSFSSVRDTIVHIWGAEWIWLERWNGRSPRSLPLAESSATLSQLKALWEETERAQSLFVAGLSAAKLERVVEYRNVRGHTFAYPLVKMLQHVVNHSTYHRGQVTTMLRQLGAKPAATDLLWYYDFLAGNPEE
jgi:uncharacterized damage-inducible protein DinB